MTRLVIDASSTLAWCFEDEDGSASDALIDRIAADGATVPAHWSLEVANALIMGERRNRITPADCAAFVVMLEDLPISTDQSTGMRALRETMSLTRELGLTSYDAAYLDLAMRLGLPLATADRKLADAADRTGVARFSDGTSGG